MPGKLPAITGRQLIRLFHEAGFTIKRKKKHVSMSKRLRSGRNVVVVIKDTADSLPRRTLSRILGPKQTGLGRAWLQQQIEKFGL